MPAVSCAAADVATTRPDDAEPEAAHVVQVDDEEREDDAVPERVHDAAELQQPDLRAAAAGRACGRAGGSPAEGIVGVVDEARWWELRPAQNLKAASYVCPLCDGMLHATSEHALDRARGRSVAAPPRAHGVRRRGAARGEASDPRRMAEEAAAIDCLELPAPVAQGIERSPPERKVAGSIPAGRIIRCFALEGRRQAGYWGFRPTMTARLP